MKPMHISGLKVVATVGLLATLGTTAQAQLLHRYDFTTDASDSVGTANGTLGTGTIVGGFLNTDGGGSTTGVSLPASAVNGITGAFTVETWLSASSFQPGYSTAFAFSDSTTANYLIGTPLRGNASLSSIAARGAGGSGGSTEQQVNGPALNNAPAQHQMLLSYDGTTLTYYIDGAQAGGANNLADTGLNLSSLSTQIGINSGSPWGDPSMNGSTYDFRIYGQSLTAGQVSSVFGLGSDASNSAIDAAISPVPEPSVLALGGLGLLATVFRLRKK